MTDDDIEHRLPIAKPVEFLYEGSSGGKIQLPKSDALTSADKAENQKQNR